MTAFVEWISAEASEEGSGAAHVSHTRYRRQKDGNNLQRRSGSWQTLPVHNFSRRKVDGPDLQAGSPYDWQADPDIWLYRRKTTALLRRYMQCSLDAGRVPSLLGRELFRAKVSAYKSSTFEDRVIFLHDMERCLERLQRFDRELIARVVLQEYDHEAAARILQCTRKTVERRLPEVIDELSDSFLKARLLQRLPETTVQQ